MRPIFTRIWRRVKDKQTLSGSECYSSSGKDFGAAIRKVFDMPSIPDSLPQKHYLEHSRIGAGGGATLPLPFDSEIHPAVRAP